jgi:hypothetical protein
VIAPLADITRRASTHPLDAFRIPGAKGQRSRLERTDGPCAPTDSTSELRTGKPHARDALPSHALQAIAEQEEAFEQYELFQSMDHPDKVVLLERWASQASLDKHREAERTSNRSLIDALVVLWAPGTTPAIDRFEA